MPVKFVRYPLPFLGVGWRFLLGRDIRPDLREICIDTQPLLGAGLGIRLDRIHRAFGFADAAIDALDGVDYEHVLALVEAIHGADFHAIHVFAFDAIVVDDVGHRLTEPPVYASIAPTAWLIGAQVRR